MTRNGTERRSSSHAVPLLPPTHSHHVVPAVQVTQVEPLSVGGGGGDEHRDVPVAVLEDAHRPRAQEPADRHQHHSQNPQQVEAGHVGHPLGRAREEHLQHPARRARINHHVTAAEKTQTFPKTLKYAPSLHFIRYTCSI